MHHFAVIALMALAIVKLVDFVADNLTVLERFRSAMGIAGGVAAAWLLDYSLFAGWDIAIRNDDTGVWFTGLAMAGMTVPWRALFGFLTNHQAHADETLGERSHLRAA